MSRPTSLDRFQGCVLGAAIGDALGAPYEFKTSPNVYFETDGYKVGVFNTEPGEATDDSTLLSFHAEAIIKGNVTGEYVNSLIAWWHKHPKDMGGQTALAIQAHMNHKEPPDGGSCGNGSLMAVAPAGLVAKNPIAAARDGHNFSKLTHPNELCRYVCGVFTEMIYEASRTDNNEYDFNVIHMPRYYPADGPKMGYAPIAAAIATEALSRILYKHEFETGFEALKWVIERGGDADTNASIAGALIGAYYGMKIWEGPGWLLGTLANTDYWFGLASKLYESCSG